MEENCKYYDVVIVGAGPGGLRCAEFLSKSNKSVLMLEKNEKIGPKVCAGGISRKTRKLLKIPPELIKKTFQNIIFKTNSLESKLKFGEDYMYTVDREELGQWQLKKLDDSGVEIRIGANVTKIEKECLIINDTEKIKFHYLVGADGSNSIVRRHLGLKTKKLGVAFQYLVPKIYPDFEIYFNSKLFSYWYSWIFPKGEYTSIGFGCSPYILPMKKARENFEIWAKKNSIDISQGKFEAHPINCDYQGYRFGKIFLIGDAAGFTSGFTGEGIYQALVSGEEVAKLIINSAYRSKRIPKLRREVYLHNFMLCVIGCAGPLRNLVFNWVVFCVKSKFLSRTLLRVLT
jgi:geranylgeranyl reductase